MYFTIKAFALNLIFIALSVLALIYSANFWLQHPSYTVFASITAGASLATVGSIVWLIRSIARKWQIDGINEVLDELMRTDVLHTPLDSLKLNMEGYECVDLSRYEDRFGIDFIGPGTVRRIVAHPDGVHDNLVRVIEPRELKQLRSRLEVFLLQSKPLVSA